MLSLLRKFVLCYNFFPFLFVENKIVYYFCAPEAIHGILFSIYKT
jgi:hypothetical protein